MKLTLMLSLYLGWMVAGAAGEVAIGTPHDVDRLPNGNTLITDGGSATTQTGSRVIEVDQRGRLVAAWLLDLDWAHNADPTGSGRLILSDTHNDRVIEVDAAGTILWSSDDHAPFSDGSHLRYPNDANLLTSGSILITDRDNHRLVEIDRTGQVVWQFGVTGVPGADALHLNGPHNADRLANGNTIVADSNNHRILELDAAGSVVWEYKPSGAAALDWPRDADRLANGNTLITDSRNNRIVEVDPTGTVVWQLAGVVGVPYDADRLPSGTTLVSDSVPGRVIEVDATGAVLWQYPGTTATTYDVAWITNPSSGVDLYAEIHKPIDAGPQNQYPAFVFIPGGSGTGQIFRQDAESKAAEGFIAVLFDPDGRGLSTNSGSYTIEDYCGFIQQDGLHAVLRHVASLPEVDRNNIGILSSSYGITMASGLLARHQDDPPVRYLIDFEGPSDRSDTAKVNGGHVPVSPTNHAFWAEREALTFMPDLLVDYVRLQTEGDHNPSITDNHHAILLNNAATNGFFGGQGIALWTRVNRESDNGPNQTYSVPSPAAWLSDDLDVHARVLKTLALIERAVTPTLVAGGNLTPGGSADLSIALGAALGGLPYWFAVSTGNGPSLIPGVTTVYLDLDPLVKATLTQGVLDAAGGDAWSVPIPGHLTPPSTYFVQAVYTHPGAATGFSATTGAELTITR